MRHHLDTARDPPRGVSVSTFAYEYSGGSCIPEHAHNSDQLVYASRGIMEVAAGQSMWIIPPHFAIWVPARTSHRIRMSSAVSMRTLYLRRRLLTLSQTCTVLHIDSLLRELIVEAVRVGSLRIRNHVECALRDLLIAKLTRASSVPTGIAIPREARASMIAQIVIRNPGTHRTLASLCSEIGLSVRTLERVFRKDVGMDFESWRRQVRLMKAIELLISGSSVKEAAYSVGYQQPTAFVAFFKATFGATPRAWISGLERLG